MSSDASPAADPKSLIRSRQYRFLLLLAAAIGLLVSAASWCFLQLVHELQDGVYTNLPEALGYETAPLWWPLPWLALAGLLTAVAIGRLPGRGGHVPAEGLKTGGGPTRPLELPSVLLAATATLGFGLVLGPEAPLIALGSGLGVLAVRLVRKDAPQQVFGLMAAAGSFAAIATVFGSPVIGAIIILEAMGLGGPMVPLVLLPGLLSAGIGSLVFIGLGSWSGLSTSAWQLSPFPLTEFTGPGWGDFGWTVLLAIALAVAAFVVLELARWSKRLVEQHLVALTIVAGLVVGGLAIAFAEITGQEADAVLFSGQDAFSGLFDEAATISLATLAWLLLLKGAAWSISLGSFRGGPTFPAIFLGVVAGLMAAELPGYAESQAIAVGIGAMCVAILRLPLSSVVIAVLLTANAGLAVTPLVIVAVVAAYLTSETLTAYLDKRVAPGPHADKTGADAGSPITQ